MSFWFALLAAFFMGTAPAFARVGLEKIEPLTALVIRSTSVTLILFIMLFFRQVFFPAQISITLPSAGYIALEGFFGALLGHLAYYYALRMGEVSVVVPVMAVFPLIAFIYGLLLFNESISPLKISGITAVVAGLIMLRMS